MTETLIREMLRYLIEMRSYIEHALCSSGSIVQFIERSCVPTKQGFAILNRNAVGQSNFGEFRSRDLEEP
jgi:hypothetical protein